MAAIGFLIRLENQVVLIAVGLTLRCGLSWTCHVLSENSNGLTCVIGWKQGNYGLPISHRLVSSSGVYDRSSIEKCGCSDVWAIVVPAQNLSFIVYVYVRFY